MTTACHAAAGALVGSLVGSPPLAFAAGLASHAVLDIVPHYDLADWRIDVVATLTIATLLMIVSGGNPAIVWGVIGGTLPDLENLVMHLGWIRSEQRVFPTHDGPWPHGRALGSPHALWQVGIIALAFWRSTS